MVPTRLCSQTLDYMLSASTSGLLHLEQVKLNEASNLHKEIRGLLIRWMEARVTAEMTRLVIEDERLHARGIGPPQRTFTFQTRSAKKAQRLKDFA